MQRPKLALVTVKAPLGDEIFTRRQNAFNADLPLRARYQAGLRQTLPDTRRYRSVVGIEAQSACPGSTYVRASV